MAQKSTFRFNTMRQNHQPQNSRILIPSVAFCVEIRPKKSQKRPQIVSFYVKAPRHKNPFNYLTFLKKPPFPARSHTVAPPPSNSQKYQNGPATPPQHPPLKHMGSPPSPHVLLLGLHFDLTSVRSRDFLYPMRLLLARDSHPSIPLGRSFH